MHAPPEELEVEDRLSQEEIEDVFNTGFGYRISGINPRRDDNDNRYILVFAKEDGPYDDSVRQGRFEYVGEGLHGDQSKSSSGNSALIDAVSTDIPVYFFFKATNSEKWEYQGLIDIINYEFKEKKGRKVLVFTMEHRPRLGDSIGSEEQESEKGIKNKKDTITIDRMSNAGNAIYTKEKKEFNLGPLSPEAVGKSVEIYQNNGIYLLCDPEECEYADEAYRFHMARKQFDESYVPEEITVEVAEVTKKGVFPQEIVIGELGTHRPIQVSLDEGSPGDVVRAKVTSLKRFFAIDGPIDANVIEYIDTDSTVADQDQSLSPNEEVTPVRQDTDTTIEGEKNAIEQAVTSDPQLTEDQEQYREIRQRARDSTFVELVRDVYDGQCAICGSSRESPDGNPEVEAAHIYPKRKGGSDDVRNGVALCKLHHWAFDVGWLSFTDDHEIMVAEVPERNGYHELKQLEGQPLYLPENEDVYPHPMFLEQHRELHGFEQ